MLTTENYRSSDFINYSALKLFSVCPRLYYEQYVTKMYVEPDHDYFVYGSLVDCMLTTPHDLERKYVRVDRTINPEHTLKHEQKIKDLEAELEPIRAKAESGNKTAIKGVEKREAEINELKEKLRSLSSMSDKKQITAGMWDNAVETAEAIKRNPTFQQLDFNTFTSQQVVADPESMRKGMLDFVSFSPPIQTLYSLYKTKHIEYAEFKTKVNEISEENKYGWIWDIKTTALISSFDPSIYAGQLGWYREIVEAVVGIRCNCGIIAGDKDPSVKRSQDYVLAASLLDEAHARTLEVEQAFKDCREAGNYPGAKEFRGIEQECFRCSVCSDRPFSVSSPLMVDAPLKLRNR